MFHTSHNQTHYRALYATECMICTHTHTHTHKYIHISIHTYIHKYINTYIHTSTRMHCNTYIHRHIHIHAHTFMYIHIHIYTHTYRYTTSLTLYHTPSRSHRTVQLPINCFHRAVPLLLHSCLLLFSKRTTVAISAIFNIYIHTYILNAYIYKFIHEQCSCP